MSKVRGDPLRVALAHPTREALVSSLNGTAEMSTVQLQKSTGVTRYHLYHHLQQLEKAGVVENHRNEGRARWWRLTGPIEIPSEDSSATPVADLSGCCCTDKGKACAKADVVGEGCGCSCGRCGKK